MRRSDLVLAGAVVALLAAMVLAAGAMRGSEDEDQRSEVAALRALERARLQSLVAGDPAAVRDVMAADYQLVDPVGHLSNREAYLAEVGAGDLDFRELTPVSGIAVRLAGDAAAVRYELEIDIVAFGQRLRHKAWVTNLYQKQDGRWRLLWEQTTARPDDEDAWLRALRPTG